MLSQLFVAFGTIRALERAGFYVNRGGSASPIEIEVLEQGEKTTWRLASGETVHEFISLYDLIESLK